MFRPQNSSYRALAAPLFVLSLTGLIGCASIGSPGGGLYDEKPPVLRTSDPVEGATGVTKQKLTLRFDENVKLDNAMEKVTISPPQVKSPSILSNAKTVTIELLDSLKPNTTYTINLGDAVQDNNEGNPMENLTLTFSTGDHIDTMQVSGVLLNAEDLEPITGAYVGIYKVYDDGSLVQGDSLTGVDSIISLFPDSVFMLKPFERVGKTDSHGHFNIYGMGAGQYRVYALKDGNTNYRYDLFDENIAFLDSLVVPSMEPCVYYDTIFSKRSLLSLEVGTEEDEEEHRHDSLPIDTIIARDGFRYLPDNLCLLAFNEGRVNRYLDETTWRDSLHIDMRFAARMDSLPVITLLDEDTLGVAQVNKESWLICEPNPTNDTLTFWIRDPEIYKRDTLQLVVTYPFTQDGVDVLVTDTIAYYNPVPKPEEKPKKEQKQEDTPAAADSEDSSTESAQDATLPADAQPEMAAAAADDKASAKEKKKKRKKKKKEAEEAPADTLPKTVFMTLTLMGKNTIDIGERPRLEVSAPLDSMTFGSLHLEQKKDTLWVPMEFSLEQDSLILRRYTLHAHPHFSPGAEYRFIADSASMRDVYGHPVDSTCLTFREKKVEEYAHLVFNIVGAEGPAFVQLLNEKDKPVKQVQVKNGQAKFVNIPAGKYYARLVEDANDNGRFDAGSLLDRRQPERVYYFDALLELREWQYSQSWDIHAQPIEQQKPKALIQNKPKEKTKKKNRNLEYLKDHPDLREKYLRSL